MIKYILLATVFVVLLISSFAQAENLTFLWTANPPTTEGYRLYMDAGTNVVADNIPQAQTTYSLDIDLEGECHNFWLRAFNGYEESGNSDIAIACPVPSDPPPPIQLDNVSGFTITVTPN